MSFHTLTGLSRFKDVIFTLARFGFQDLLERLELPFSSQNHAKDSGEHDQHTWVRVRRVLEELGPTFVKFGQVVSQRPDMLPKELIAELAKLQDQVEPEPFEHIRQVMEEDLGRPLEEVFSLFDQEPLAAASLSQVHRGVLAESGQVVAVKVQRLGIESIVEADLNIIRGLASRLHERVDELKHHDVPRLVEMGCRTMLAELDFRQEVRHMRIARANLAQDQVVTVPQVYQEHCSRRVLVMELVNGRRLRDLGDLDSEKSQNLAKAGLGSMIRQILRDGFFHADPHPGNLLYGEDGRLFMVDWGQVGRLSRQARYRLIDLIQAMVERDGDQMVDAVLMITSPEEDFSRSTLTADLDQVLEAYLVEELGQLRVGNLMSEVARLLNRYGLALPPDFAILVKSLVTAEGTARLLYPKLDVVGEAEPLVRGLALERYQPKHLWRATRASISSLAELQARAPRLLLRLSEQIEQEGLNLGFEHKNLGGLQRTLETVSNRLTLGIIIAAMLIGSSIIITTGAQPHILGFPALGVVGYLASGVLGVWLISSILRRKDW